MAKKNDTICWKCKCATNPIGTNCPWAEEGKPVPGWDAQLGKVFRMESGRGKYRLVQSYQVKKCPLFEQDCEFSTRKEVVDEIAETLGLPASLVSGHLLAKIAIWENKTGRKMPDWVKIKTQG